MFAAHAASDAGSTAAAPIATNTVIKSQYKLNGQPLEVDPD